MPPKINLLSLDIIFFQTKPTILHQYPVFLRCQRYISLALCHIQYEWIIPLHIPDLPAKCQIAVILLPQIYDYIVVYLHKSIFDTLYEIAVSLCCCVHFYHPFVFIIIYPFFTATTNMRTALRFARPLCRRHWFPNTAFFTVPGLYFLSPAPFLLPPAQRPARYFLSCPYQAGHLTPPAGQSFPLTPAPLETL